MKKQALVLGLTAALYAFVLLPLGLMVWSWTDASVPVPLINGVVLVAAFVAAWMLAPLVAGEDEPPPLLVVLLLFSAGYVLLFKVLAVFGVTFGYNKFSQFLHRVEGWA